MGFLEKFKEKNTVRYDLQTGKISSIAKYKNVVDENGNPIEENFDEIVDRKVNDKIVGVLNDQAEGDRETESSDGAVFGNTEGEKNTATGPWFFIRIFMCLYVVWIGAGLIRDAINKSLTYWYIVGGAAFVLIGAGIIVMDLRYYFKNRDERVAKEAEETEEETTEEIEEAEEAEAEITEEITKEIKEETEL